MALPGDFDDNGQYECADVDALVVEIVGGSNNGAFDLDGNGLVNQSDLASWLALAGAENLVSGAAYLSGDANLDGTVDGQDFLVWNNNKFSTTSAWCSGDFTGDGIVDGADFLNWNSNKFQSADVDAVPEPSTLMIIGLGVTALFVGRNSSPTKVVGLG